MRQDFLTDWKVTLCWVVISGVLLITTSCQMTKDGSGKQNKNVILEIGNHQIDLDAFLFYVEKSYPEAQGELDDQLWSRFFDRFKRDVLVAELATIMGLRVTQEQIDRFIEVQLPGMTFRLLPLEEQDKWTEEIKRRLAIQQFLQREVIQQVSISEDAINEYYQTHQEHYRRNAEYRIRHVQTLDRERAEAFRQALRNTKEPFTKIAAEYSENDGYLIAPSLELDALPEAFQAELKRMRAGQYSRVVSVQYGDTTYYHVLYLESVRPAFTVGFEDAYPEILRSLEKQAAAELLKQKLDRFEEKITLKVHEDRLPFSYVPADQRGDST